MDIKPTQFRIARWFGVIAIGIVGGMIAGHLTIGHRYEQDGSGFRSFAGRSGNPDAVGADVRPVEPCYGCADSYGVASRLRAEREERMDPAFRELGAVEIDDAPSEQDDYSYGGRFEEPAAEAVVVSRPAQVPPIADRITEETGETGASLTDPVPVPSEPLGEATPPQ